MTTEAQTEERKNHSFGFAAVCFAGLLTLVTLDRIQGCFEWAFHCFAAGVPLSIAAAFLHHMRRGPTSALQQWLVGIIDWGSALITWLGIYFLLREAHATTGSVFLFSTIASIACVIAYKFQTPRNPTAP